MFEAARLLTAADAEQWRRSRAGSHAGRGFRYQDAGATELAVKGLTGELPVHAVIPEGLDDVTLGMAAGRVEAQFKSRRAEQGSFSVGEVVTHLVDLGVRHRTWLGEAPRARLALVLERPVARVPQSGWTAVIADVPELAAALGPIMRDEAVAAGLDLDVLLASTHLVISTDPAEAAIDGLAERNQLAPAVARQCYLALLDAVATLADENGVRKAGDPALLTVGDAQRVYDEALALVDLAGLEAAVREGICEAADFVTPLVDPGFYAGVDVVPGHVVAGLTMERPQELAAIERGLSDRRAVLVVGPSGSGKSALVWMAAYATRHVVRRYRVKRLAEADVAPRCASSTRCAQLTGRLWGWPSTTLASPAARVGTRSPKLCSRDLAYCYSGASGRRTCSPCRPPSGPSRFGRASTPRWREPSGRSSATRTRPRGRTGPSRSSARTGYCLSTCTCSRPAGAWPRPSRRRSTSACGKSATSNSASCGWLLRRPPGARRSTSRRSTPLLGCPRRSCSGRSLGCLTSTCSCR